jgi:hypothetical protein
MLLYSILIHLLCGLPVTFFILVHDPCLEIFGAEPKTMVSKLFGHRPPQKFGHLWSTKEALVHLQILPLI